MDDNQRMHEQIIKQFLSELNKESDVFILKGGTSLRQCYGLDRFSEDIDLDATAKNIIPFAKRFCQKHGYTLRIAKDTKNVKRCFINYDDLKKPLKIEVSYRQKSIPEGEINNINGIMVYTIDRIAQMKAMAYSSRDKIRDLYDITYLCNKYFDSLSDNTKSLLVDALSRKGLEEFDYLVKTQRDPLINTDKLASDFLDASSKLGVLYDEDEITNSICSIRSKSSLQKPAELVESISDEIINGLRKGNKLYLLERKLQSKLAGTISEKKRLLKEAENRAAEKDNKAKEIIGKARSSTHSI